MNGTELVSMVDTIQGILRNTYDNYYWLGRKDVFRKPYASIVVADEDSLMGVSYIPYVCMLFSTSDNMFVFAVARPKGLSDGEMFEKLYIFGKCDESSLIYAEKVLHIGGVTEYIYNDEHLNRIIDDDKSPIKELFDYFEDKHQTRDSSNYPTNLDVLDSIFDCNN